MRDKIVKRVLKYSHKYPFVPVVVRFRDEKSMWDIWREFRLFNVAPSVARELVVFNRVVPRFRVFGGVVSRRDVFVIAERRGVERIYPLDFVTVLGYPTVPSGGVYSSAAAGVFTTTYWTRRLIGADRAVSAGFTGRGVSVAVLDTGVGVHEQVNNTVSDSVYRMQLYDGNGHGTWVITTINGRLATTRLYEGGSPIPVEGVAPAANIISIKCLGYGVGIGTTIDIIEAVDRALSRGADVINMSLGGDITVGSQGDDPYKLVFDEVVKSNVIPVAAAGNSGPDEGSINTPAWLDNVLAVGAYDPITGKVAEYSSRGPTPDGRVKPDVIAPGGGYPENGILSGAVGITDFISDKIYNRYAPIQGTSMAAPHVSGLIAIMREAHSRLLGKILNLDEVIRMLRALRGDNKNNVEGWGLFSWDLYVEWLGTEYGVKI